MDSRKLDYFLKVCDAGSIAGAARSTYISQQALSRCIEAMEEELGVRLFVRTPQGLLLTECGRYLRDETVKTLQHQDAALRRLREMKEERRSSLSISFFEGMPRLYPDGFFEDFIAEHPGTAFHLFAYQDNEHGRSFANPDVDLFFSTGPMLLDGMELAHVFRYPMFALMSRSHPLAGQRSVRLVQLRGVNLISLNSDVDSQNAVMKEFSRCGISSGSVLSISNQPLSYCLIRQQNAVAFYAGPDSLLPPDMVRLEITDLPMEWAGYIYRRAGGLPQAGEELLDRMLAFRSRGSAAAEQ